MKKVIASIYVSTNKPEWTCLNFEAYRNEDDEIVFPKEIWMDSTLAKTLDVKVGDVVA